MKKLLSVIISLSLIIGTLAMFSSCEEKEEDIKNFEYTTIEGGIEITKYLGNSKKVVVPSVIDNKKVISITDTTFSGNIVLEEITLPEYLDIYFDSKLLKGCDSLKTINVLCPVWSFACPILPALETINFSKVTTSTLSSMNWDHYFDYCSLLCNINIQEFTTVPSISSWYDALSGESQFFEKRTINFVIPEDTLEEIYKKYPDNTNNSICEIFGCSNLTVNGTSYSYQGTYKNSNFN